VLVSGFANLDDVINPEPFVLNIETSWILPSVHGAISSHIYMKKWLGINNADDNDESRRRERTKLNVTRPKRPREKSIFNKGVHCRYHHQTTRIIDFKSKRTEKYIRIFCAEWRGLKPLWNLSRESAAFTGSCIDDSSVMSHCSVGSKWFLALEQTISASANKSTVSGYKGVHWEPYNKQGQEWRRSVSIERIRDTERMRGIAKHQPCTNEIR
jgi:hypothetical protein